MFKVLTLNNIAVEGLRHLPRERYEVASEIGHPDAILVRSHNMHDMDIPDTVAAVGRAGAGTIGIGEVLFHEDLIQLSALDHRIGSILDQARDDFTFGIPCRRIV